MNPESERKSILVGPTLKLSGTIFPGVGWALILLNALCLIGTCYAGGFPGYVILGLLAIGLGTALQRSVSSDTKDFVYKMFGGFVMGICLCGIADIGGFMISALT